MDYRDFDRFVRRKELAIQTAMELKQRFVDLGNIPDGELRVRNRYLEEGVKRGIISSRSIDPTPHSTDDSIRELVRTYPQLSREDEVFSKLVVLSMQLYEEQQRECGPHAIKRPSLQYVLGWILPTIDRMGYRMFQRKMDEGEYLSLSNGTNKVYRNAVWALNRLRTRPDVAIKDDD